MDYEEMYSTKVIIQLFSIYMLCGRRHHARCVQVATRGSATPKSPVAQKAQFQSYTIVTSRRQKNQEEAFFFLAHALCKQFLFKLLYYKIHYYSSKMIIVQFCLLM